VFGSLYYDNCLGRSPERPTWMGSGENWSQFRPVRANGDATRAGGAGAMECGGLPPLSKPTQPRHRRIQAGFLGRFDPSLLLSVSGRGNFPAFSSGPGNRLRQPIGARVQAQEPKDRTLRLGQLGHHYLGLSLTDPNLVPLDRREHLD
jgi:hypothetical protein